MDKATAIDIVRRYSELLRARMEVRKVVLYGSCVRGVASDFSDIDVAVIVDHVPDDVLAAETDLFRLRHSVDDRIEPVILESGDDRSGFLSEIMKTGEVVYEQET
ncbi:MAG: nucleotidyltransferase domain-containing protein [Deltaproteobacteria bacterium]|nr:nucleotidyltransferase domain-containing protein [Deltaproteobacteria bacterium]